MKIIIACVVLFLFAACGREVNPVKGTLGKERAATEKLLGVEVKDLPDMNVFVDSDPNAPTYMGLMRYQGSAPIDLDPDLGSRPSVYATAPDGSLWEAYCGKPGPKPAGFSSASQDSDTTASTEIVEPYKDFKSTPENARQSYDTHHGYSYNPSDIFVGKSENGRLATTLFFRDVGSHNTAPHHIAIDQSGNVHLAVADVNISNDNDLDLYWVIGSTDSGKWTSAYKVDHRGFTSVANVWNGAYHDKVHLLWSWDSGETKLPEIGLYHIEKDPSGFSRKVRIFKGDVMSMSAAIDLSSGRILVIVTNNEGGFLISKEEGKNWTRPAKSPSFRNAYVQLSPGESGYFILTVNDMNSITTWSIEPNN